MRRAVCDVVLRPFDPADIDITGSWIGNDEGVYYIREIGSDVFWNGMSDVGGPADTVGRSWNNVAMGTLEGTTLALLWADVPRSASDGAGELTIEEVLRASIRAGSVAAAAHELGISETTVRQHLSGLCRRTGCVNAAQAAYWLGLGQPREPGRTAAAKVYR